MSRNPLDISDIVEPQATFLFKYVNQSVQVCAVHGCAAYERFDADPRLDLADLRVEAEEMGWALKALDAPPMDPEDRRYFYLCHAHKGMTVEQVLLGWPS